MNNLKSRALIVLFTVFLLAGLFPASAGAYSYGNANTEAVAETFKLVASKLNADTADWPSAKAAYAEVRSELESHFGKDVAKELDDAFAAEDKDRVMQDWKGVLVLNLERRFTYAEQGFDNYSEAKLLLAKARATFETLKPYLSGTPAESKRAEIEQAFDKALEALGNPGLLGVGKKDPNPEVFKQNIKMINDTVSPLFPMSGGVKAGNPPAGDGAATPAPHAPMEEADKTNTAVTVGAIAVVVVVAGLLLLRSRRRKS